MAEIIEKIVSSTAWDKYESKDLLFPADAIIAAWEDGKKVENEKLFTELISNINNVSQDVFSLLQSLAEVGINATTARLRINNRKSFDILVGVSQENYLAPAFLQAYKFANEIELKRREDYLIHFSFVDVVDSLDNSELIADRYNLIHKKYKHSEPS